MSPDFSIMSYDTSAVSMWMEGPSSTYQGVSSALFTAFMTMPSTVSDNPTIRFFLENSNSIPWTDTVTNRPYLEPRWRFLDTEGTIVDGITITDRVLTAIGGGTSAYLLSTQFAFIDDLPTVGTSPSVWIGADFSDYSAFDGTIYSISGIPGCVNGNIITGAEVFIDNTTPTRLDISRDGENPLYGYYWTGIANPATVSVYGETPDGREGRMFSVPPSDLSGIAGGPVIRSIPLIDSQYITWSPNNSNSYLSAASAGYQDFTFLSTQATTGVQISACVSAYYTGSALPALICGQSSAFNMLDFDQYDMRKFNESWEAVGWIKDTVRQDHILLNPTLWDKYMKALWGDESTPQGEAFGREAYEKIANFVSNHSDVNTCDIKSLYDMAQKMDVPIDDYAVEFPPELRRIVDLASVNQQVLWGDRCHCHRNITNGATTYLSGGQTHDTYYLCDVCGHYHPGNRGELFDSTNYEVTAFQPFIVEDKHQNKAHRLITPPASSYYVVQPYDLLLNGDAQMTTTGEYPNPYYGSRVAVSAIEMYWHNPYAYVGNQTTHGYFQYAIDTIFPDPTLHEVEFRNQTNNNSHQSAYMLHTSEIFKPNVETDISFYYATRSGTPLTALSGFSNLHFFCSGVSGVQLLSSLVREVSVYDIFSSPWIILSGNYTFTATPSIPGNLLVAWDKTVKRSVTFDTDNISVYYANPADYDTVDYDPCLLSTLPILCSTNIYPLSSTYDWLLPEPDMSFGELPNRYCFYDYVSGSCPEQIAGIINWDDPYTSLLETASTNEEWYGDEENLEKIINYTLHKGLGYTE